VVLRFHHDATPEARPSSRSPDSRRRSRGRPIRSPDVIAIVTGRDIALMDAVIDRIAEVPDIAGTDSKVARWIDGLEFPAGPVAAAEQGEDA
jgi:hypothetical protein